MANLIARPSFHSTDLCVALEQAAPRIEAFVATLDQVSEDIKLLEEYLDKSGVRVPATVEVGLGAGEPGVSERLSWSCVEDTRRWRIMYERRIGTGTPDRRPLIEAPAETRLDAYLALPDLLKAVAERVTVAKPEDGIE